MNASLEWLNELVPLGATPRQLRDLLTAHTATVDELVPLRADLAPIVVARVTEAAPHPDSDHLWFTRVDDGGAEPLEVICGAANVRAGKLYPFARVGVTMPNGITIERRKIRGIVSNGMLCSARELKLGDDHQGILELSVEAAPGTPFLAAMPIGDTLLVIDVGANRPDLLSHAGLARELSAITGTPWRLPELPGLGPAIAPPRSASTQGDTAGVTVRVDADTRTRRYMAAVLRGIEVRPSPEWLTRRLEAVGVRAVNNVVDATNYLLHELGQPIHAFDLGRIDGGVVVRLATRGEALVTLDGSTRAFPAAAVVIADARRALAVAGVMGGRDSEVTATTRDLLVEVASFDPKLMRRARRALGLSTDASYRFERGVDPELAPQALDRVVRLIVALAGGTLADAPIDIRDGNAPSREITLRMARVAQVLGTPIKASDARRSLEAAGFALSTPRADELRVRIPTWRDDVHGEVDLVEEIARFAGYESFPDEIRPYRPSTTLDDPRWAQADRVRRELVGLGCFEVRPMPFVRGNDTTHVRVTNPLSESDAWLRSRICESLTARAEHNLAQRLGDLRLFEVGSVFAPSGAAMPSERLQVGVLLMGRRRPPHFSEPNPPVFDEWDAEAVAERTARAAFPGESVSLKPADGDRLWDILANDRVVGAVMRLALDAPVWAAPAFGVEITLDEYATAPPAPRGQHDYSTGVAPVVTAARRYRPLPTQPAAEFDLALLIPPGVSAAAVERLLRRSAGELLEGLTLFDEYTGAGIPPGYRSLAWRLTLRHAERTLREKEIEGRRVRILRALEEELNVRQRTA